MKFNARVVGSKKGLQFKKFGDEGRKILEDITKIHAYEVAAEAKRLAKKDTSKMAQGIAVEEESKTSYLIAATEKYSAFVEFGTGMLTSIPKGWEEIAHLFKGKGIRQVNLPARPFLYPAFKKGGDRYLRDLNKALSRLTEKYNK